MTGMEHAIEHAVRVLAAHQLGGPRGGTAGVAWCECACGARLGISGGDRKYAMSLGIRHVALALAEAGLLAPTPLREEWGVQWDDHDIWGDMYNTRHEAETGAGDEGTPVHRFVTGWEEA